jgi:hypothetical protein
VPPAGVGDNRQESVAFRRNQSCAGGQIDVSLCPNRVLR